MRLIRWQVRLSMTRPKLMVVVQFTYAFVALWICFALFTTGIRWWVVAVSCTITGALFAALFRFSMKRMGYWGSSAAH